MRLGVLDVGSNTVHLIVVDAHRGAHPTPMHDDRWLLRLAEQIGDDGMLSKAGEKALLRAVEQACEQAEKQGCEELMALVTAAIRDAENGLEVLDRIRQRTGVDLQVLSGEEEARLTFLAVRRWFGWSAGKLLILDIGGGSPELACGVGEEPHGAPSLPPRPGRRARRLPPRAPGGRAPAPPPAAQLRDHAAVPAGGPGGRTAGSLRAGQAELARRGPARPGGEEDREARPAGPHRGHEQDVPDAGAPHRGRSLLRGHVGPARAATGVTRAA